MAEKSFRFRVDSALLKELGERLVGKPYIALSELIKNSYDADANDVSITLKKRPREIVVLDDGHGMTIDEFENLWMRIGSTHKAHRVSKKYGRQLTGSKGIGRLAVQFLAKELELYTVADDTPNMRLKAWVDWDQAVETKELTEVEIKYTVEEGDDFEPGTMLVLKSLKDAWSIHEVKALAKEIWRLKPPLRGKATEKELRHVFNIEFLSHKELVDAFDYQMRSIMDIWYAKIVGENDHGDVAISIEWAGKKPRTFRYTRERCKLGTGDFEIRIYHLFKRQPRGIKVNDARAYLKDYGGINIYDSGFRLPYYGDPKNDWLGIELDHSHRKDMSEILPESLRKGVRRGLQFLPTMTRLLGVVNVDTSRESNLEILVTRDRLKETAAFEDLRWIVRFALDLYALWEKQRMLKEKEPSKEVVEEKVRTVEEVLDEYEKIIPDDTFTQLRTEIKHAVEMTRTEAEWIASEVALIGTLATAGLTAVSYQHDTKTLFKRMDGIIRQAKQLETSIKNVELRGQLRHLRDNLESWIDRAKSTNALFQHLTSPENVKNRERYPAKKVISDIAKQLKILLKGVPIYVERVDPDLYLPASSLAEWTSIFQNVFLNSYNAMLASKKRQINVSSRSRGLNKEILVQDTGLGVDLEISEKLFEPFERETKLPTYLKAAGYGGTGLGLTIVRMVARNIGCKVAFVKPEKKFTTAFSVRWREGK